MQGQKNRDVFADCSIHYVGHPIIEQSLEFCVQNSEDREEGGEGNNVIPALVRDYFTFGINSRQREDYSFVIIIRKEYHYLNLMY